MRAAFQELDVGRLGIRVGKLGTPERVSAVYTFAMATRFLVRWQFQRP